MICYDCESCVLTDDAKNYFCEVTKQLVNKEDVCTAKLDTFFVPKEETELDSLEHIYTKVKLGEIVKFNGKGYLRIKPKHNKYMTYKYHFTLINKDLSHSSSNFYTTDKWGEDVSTNCDFRVIYKKEDN